MKCPIRGHEHELNVQRTLTQAGTTAQAVVWECPTGLYRWFQLKERADAGEPVSPFTKSVRPRWGWKEE